MFGKHKPARAMNLNLNRHEREAAKMHLGCGIHYTHMRILKLPGLKGETEGRATDDSKVLL